MCSHTGKGRRFGLARLWAFYPLLKVSWMQQLCIFSKIKKKRNLLLAVTSGNPLRKATDGWRAVLLGAQCEQPGPRG